MNAAMQRLLPAWLLTLAVHGLFLNWRLEYKPIKLPEPEKISVTLRHPPPPPPPQQKITKTLPPPPELQPVERQPLETLPPPQQKILKPVRKIPAVRQVQHKPLAKLPPPQRRIARRLPPPPMTVPAAPNLQPLAMLPPAQGRISRQLPRLPAEALAEQPLPQPLQTLPPEPEPVWEEVPEEVVEEPVYEEVVPEEVVQEPVYEEFVPDDVIVDDSPPPMETFAEPVWEEPVAPPPRQQRYVRRERRVRQVRRQPTSSYSPPPRRRTVSRNYEQRAAASSSYGSGDREAAPRYDINPEPSYPMQARRRGLQGTVMLKVLVDAGGSVADVRLAGSSGHSILDRAAMNAVRSWSFTPGMSGGRPKQMWVMVPVRFALN